MVMVMVEIDGDECGGRERDGNRIDINTVRGYVGEKYSRRKDGIGRCGVIQIRK